MTTTLNIRQDGGHILLPIDDRIALVDTGSPVSFAGEPFSFGGESYSPPTNMMGVTTQTLSELAGFNIDILIGCDILSEHTIRFRWNDKCIDIGDDIPDGAIASRMETLQGSPVFPLDIGAIGVNAIFDTGAHLSYIRPALVEGIAQTGEKADFHPFNGHFTAPTYQVKTQIGIHDFDMEYGILPGLLQQAVNMAFQMSGSSAVIGTQLLEHFDCTISWKRKMISWSKSEILPKNRTAG